VVHHGLSEFSGEDAVVLGLDHAIHA
jgi:hypothetical protein